MQVASFCSLSCSKGGDIARLFADDDDLSTTIIRPLLNVGLLHTVAAFPILGFPYQMIKIPPYNLLVISK